MSYILTGMMTSHMMSGKTDVHATMTTFIAAYISVLRLNTHYTSKLTLQNPLNLSHLNGMSSQKNLHPAAFNEAYDCLLCISKNRKITSNSHAQDRRSKIIHSLLQKT